MINYILGRCGAGKSTEIIRRISHTLQTTGREVLLLVPEQQTVVWETLVAERLPETELLRVEVTNFTRLANSVFRAFGGLAMNRCDDGGRALILWRAMLSVWGGLTVYNKGLDGREDRNLPSLMAAVGEMKQNGVSPLQLEEAAWDLEQAEGESELTRRLYDLSLVYAAYEELLHEEYVDKNDVLNALAESVEGVGGGYFRGKECYVDSFFSLTHQQKRILRGIMGRADSLTVTFTLDPEDGGELQFGEIRAYFDDMVRLAGETLPEGEEINIVKLTEDRRHGENSRLAKVERELFGFGQLTGEDSDCSQNEGENPAENASVRVIRCADRYEEAELCAALIEKLVREGARYSDIAVVARNMTSRCGIVDTALRRHGIPCFIAERSTLGAEPAVRLISSLIDIQAGGWLRRDVIRLIKTGLTPLLDYECDLFEEYTATWNIRGRRWFGETGPWTMNPEGYRKELGPWSEEVLAIVNGARDKLMPALLRFASIFDGAEELTKKGENSGENASEPSSDNGGKTATVREIAEGIVKFCLEMDLYHALERNADELQAGGYRREAEQARQVWGQICAALDRLVLILGDTEIDAGRFGGLFGYVCGAADIGTIPTAMDEVVLGSSDGVRFSEVEHMIILGSVEGEFPGMAEDGGFFCDTDRAKLRDVGVTLSNDTNLRTAQEYFMYYRTACLGRRSLTVLVPVSDGAGAAREMSQGAARLVSLFGEEILTKYGDLPLEERVYHPRAAETAVTYETGARRVLLERLAGAGHGEEDPLSLAVAEERVSTETVGALFADRMSLSQSRLDSYVNCPFAYWCRYVMGLKDSPKAEIVLPDIGIFVHEVLERFFEVTAGVEYPIPATETERITDEIIEEYLSALGRGNLNGRLMYLFHRLRRNVVCFLESIMEELADSEFRPIAFELPIGLKAEGKPSLDAMVFRLADGTEVTLRGIADRVDLYRDEASGRAYIRVVDYKTGSKTFSLEDVRLGLNVQLLVYLFSIWKGRHTVVTGEKEVYPAGAVYFSARPGDMASDRMLTAAEAKELVKSRIVRSGIFLSEDSVLDAMDKEGKYIPLKLRGGKATGDKNLVTLEEFGRLYGELESVIVKICTEMKEGIASAAPLERNGRSPCDYCAHGPICRR